MEVGSQCKYIEHVGQCKYIDGIGQYKIQAGFNNIYLFCGLALIFKGDY